MNTGGAGGDNRASSGAGGGLGAKAADGPGGGVGIGVGRDVGVGAGPVVGAGVGQGAGIGVGRAVGLGVGAGLGVGPGVGRTWKGGTGATGGTFWSVVAPNFLNESTSQLRGGPGPGVTEMLKVTDLPGVSRCGSSVTLNCTMVGGPIWTAARSTGSVRWYRARRNRRVR